jgi:hypothetical protein
VDYGDSISTDVIQYTLSMGLVKFHQIITAKTFEARHKLLFSGKGYIPISTSSSFSVASNAQLKMGSTIHHFNSIRSRTVQLILGNPSSIILAPNLRAVGDGPMLRTML